VNALVARERSLTELLTDKRFQWSKSTTVGKIIQQNMKGLLIAQGNLKKKREKFYENEEINWQLFI
jgi:hypothetical protein